MKKAVSLFAVIAAVLTKEWWMQPSSILTRLNAIDGAGEEATPILLRWQYAVLTFVFALALLTISAAG